MKKYQCVFREAINCVIILLPFVYMLLVREKLPPFAPLSIEEDQRIYQIVLFVMGVAIFWYIVFLVKPVIIPKTLFTQHLQAFQRIKTLMLAFLSLLCLTFISKNIGIPYNWAKIGIILSFTYVMLIGNLYPTLKNKYLIGIKNSWTQSNELIWIKTHHFAGKVFFAGGFIGVVYGIFFNVNPVPFMPVIYVSYIFILLLIPNLYSYLLYRKTLPNK